jgi:hypothetical protein
MHIRIMFALEPGDKQNIVRHLHVFDSTPVVLPVTERACNEGMGPPVSQLHSIIHIFSMGIISTSLPSPVFLKGQPKSCAVVWPTLMTSQSQGDKPRLRPSRDLARCLSHLALCIHICQVKMPNEVDSTRCLCGWRASDTVLGSHRSQHVLFRC